MTDPTGMIEHAVFVIPNYPEGYSTDDNARALIVAILLDAFVAGAPKVSSDLASRYLAFLWLASDPATKRFRNCLSYERQWQEADGSEDSHGRALWRLGTVLGRSSDAGLRGAAGHMFELAVPSAIEFKSPRACAFAWLGVLKYLDSFPGDRAALYASDALANRLLNSYRANRSDDWKWFEGGLAYSNARLPQALLRAGVRASNEEKGRWRKEAWSAFNWFLGDNDLQIALYDPTTGGCRDGLHPDRANENQGAESTLSFLMALLEMRKLEEADGTENSSDKQGACFFAYAKLSEIDSIGVVNFL
jgi:hypothetical protein